MQRTIERWRHKLRRVPKTLASGVMLFGLVAGFFSVLLSYDVQAGGISPVSEIDHELLTTMRAEEEIVPLAGIATTSNNEIVYTAYDEDGTNLLEGRALPVTVRVDGQELVMELVQGTVADVLAELGVTLGQDDLVQPPLDTELSRSQNEVLIQRVAYEERSIRTEVLADEVEAFAASIAPQEFTTSKSRIYDVTYRDTLVDGEVTESEILSMEAIYHPYDAPSPAFEPGIAVSSIDQFVGVELDANGIPANFTRKISGAVCTAYSAARGRGAGGQGLYCGTVAVNPNVIPYGTRMYITAANGSFVYGYAIASDTGTAMMDGYVDLDLYFETNAECRKFGKRALDVYILD